MNGNTLFELGIKAQMGDSMSMLKIIERKKNLIKKMSENDEDCYQYIILKVIEGVTKYKF